MADKDTRDDLETHGEPVVTQPDGPRSEGGPVSSQPSAQDAAPEAPSNPPSPAAAEPQTPSGPVDPPAGPDPAPDTCSDPEAASLSAATDAPPVSAPEDASSGATWSGAIADALFGSEKPATAEAVTAQSTEAEAVEAEPQSVGPGDKQPAASDDPAFTDAIEGLFKPGDATHGDDTHLITLGRRLNPAKTIPRPVAPDITPRSEADPPQASAPRPAPAPAFEEKVTWKTGTWKDRLRIAARYAAYAAGAYLILILVLILLFRFVNPPGSMLILTQAIAGTSIERKWTPISSISPALIRAVIVSEDGRFCQHSGVDTSAIREAIERAAEGTPRGASTISMQVTKNLFLWNAKSYVRKVIEIPLTLIMEVVWPKERILEVYLNIAEWGPGIFGAEAAARHHFHKSAARLNSREAALLASVLPNPVARDASSPSRHTSAKARVVQARVKAYGAVASCVVRAAAAEPSERSRTRPALRPAPRAPARRKQQTEEWAPTLKFGPL